MISELTSAICKALKAEFSNCNIYKSTVSQGLKYPSFSVLCIQNTIDRKGTLTYSGNYQYAIHYYTNVNDAYNDCLNVYERAYNALKTVIMSNSKAHCYSFSYVITDNVLTITCNYRLNLIEQIDPIDKMEHQKVIYDEVE